MFPLLGFLTVCLVFTMVGLVFVLGLRVQRKIWTLLGFVIGSVPSSFFGAFVVGRIRGDQYTFSEGILALAVSGVIGGIVGAQIAYRDEPYATK